MNRTALIVAALSFVSMACSASSDSADESTRELVAEVASFDVSIERTERLLIGLFAADRSEVAQGTIQLSFAYLGPLDPTQPVDPLAPDELPQPVEAHYLAIPGTPDAANGDPTFDSPMGVRGVYGTAPIRFPTDGVWEAIVDATVDGEALSTSTVFEVFAESIVPGVGDRAPQTEQPLPGDAGVAPASIDSRLGFVDALSDPRLHQMTIADALKAGRPVMVTVTTPVFCVSRFCGPITDELTRLESVFGQHVEFVHLEVWEDFESGILNTAAAEWVAANGIERAAEPWVFLVDDTGTIVARWDNVASVDELTAALDDVTA